jgi:hypothetical protein
MLGRQLGVRHGFVFTPQVLGFWRMHGENFSTVTSMDPATLTEKIARAQRIIAAEAKGLFPQGYVELFDRRQRFGGARLLTLMKDRSAAIRARNIAALLQTGKLEELWLRSLLTMGHIGVAMTLAWLAFRLRPMSMMTLLAQFRARRSILSGYAGYHPQ